MISVLLVDDDPEFLETAKKLLKKNGDMAVHTANSAKEAIELLKKESFDVILSNYEMPCMNGIELLKALKAQKNVTPMIIYASQDKKDASMSAMRSGAEFFIQKSDDPTAQFNELKYIIEEIVKRRSTENLLIRREKDFHAIVDSNADAMIVLDKNGYIRYTNPAAIALFNLPESELLGKIFGFPVVLKEPVDMDVIRGFKEVVAAEMRMVEVEWEEKPSYLISFRDVTGHVQHEEEL